MYPIEEKFLEIAGDIADTNTHIHPLAENTHEGMQLLHSSAAIVRVRVLS